MLYATKDVVGEIRLTSATFSSHDYLCGIDSLNTITHFRHPIEDEAIPLIRYSNFVAWNILGIFCDPQRVVHALESFDPKSSDACGKSCARVSGEIKWCSPWRSDQRREDRAINNSLKGHSDVGRYESPCELYMMYLSACLGFLCRLEYPGQRKLRCQCICPHAPKASAVPAQWQGMPRHLLLHS